MSDFISTLASKSGLDNAMAEKGVGALLSSLKGNLSSDVFSKLSSAIPDGGNILQKFSASTQAADSGAASTLAGLAGGLFKGGSSNALSLVEQFTKAGFSMESIGKFVPVVLSMLQSKLGPDIMKTVEKQIPSLSGLATDGDIVSNLKKLF